MKPRLGWLGKRILKAIGMEDESFWATWSPLGPTSSHAADSQMAKAVGDGLSLDVIMAPVLWVARRMAESDIGVQESDDDTIDMTHPLARLLRRPNPWYAGSTMRMALAVNFLMDGNAYMRKLRDSRKGVAALQYLPSWCIDPIIENDTYQYRPGGVGAKTEIIPAQDIVHLRYGIDPNYTRKGLSPLKILLRELYTDMQGSTMTAMLLKNAGLMGVIISPKEGIQIAKPTETKKYIQDEFTGVRNGSAMVMTAPTDVTYFGADATKMDLGRLREIPEERICALLNIPAAVVGFGTGMQTTKVGATLVELRSMAYEDCIIPTQNSWCDEIDLQLLPDFESDPEAYSTQFDNSKVRVLQPDDNAISTRIMAQLSGGAIMLSEAREALGYETEPDEDVYFIPGSVTVTDPKELIPPPPPAPVVVAPPAGGNALGAGARPGAGNQADAGPQGKALKAGLHGNARMTPKLSRLAHRLAREEKKLRNAWEPKLEAEFKKYGRYVASAFMVTAKRHGVKEPLKNPQVKTADWDTIGREALEDVGRDNLAAGLKASYGQQYLDVATLTFESLKNILGLGVMLDDPMERSILRIGGRRLGLIDLPQDTKNAMFEAFAQGRDAGWGAQKIADAIEELVGAGKWKTAATRAQVIARTETKYAQNRMSLEAYRASENVTDVIVFDARLGPTDEECEALDGTTVSMEEALRLMETEHPNGTRSFAPVVS